jgi:hypothetical protein
MLAAAAPSGAELLFRNVTKGHVTIGLSDTGLKTPAGDAGSARTIAARGSQTL